MLMVLTGPQKIRHITLPSLSPVILFNIILGGDRHLPVLYPGVHHQYPSVAMGRMRHPARRSIRCCFTRWYLYQNAFSYLHMGYASGLAWIFAGDCYGDDPADPQNICEVGILCRQSLTLRLFLRRYRNGSVRGTGGE